MKYRELRLLALVLLLCYACSEDETPDVETPGPDIDSEIVTSLDVQLDPTGFAPLTALIDLETSQAVSVEVSVLGRQGEYLYHYSEISGNFNQLRIGDIWFVCRL